MKLLVDAFDKISATIRSDDDRVAIILTDPVLAHRIVRAFNRDRHFDALVAALSPFRSSEMGNLLIGIIDTREEGGEHAQQQLSRYVSMIDVILDAAEQTDGDSE